MDGVKCMCVGVFASEYKQERIVEQKHRLRWNSVAS